MKYGSLILAAVLSASCSRKPSPPAEPAGDPAVLVLKVEGMQRGEGGKT